MRLAIAMLVLLAATPIASAAITIDTIVVPERTMAGKAFPAALEITNDGPARSVYLFAALYAPGNGNAPCGPAADPRFRRFTHLVQETVRLPADGTLRYPTSGEWLQRYDRGDVETDPATYELCVFAANATGATARIEYEAFAKTDLSVRGVNALPVGSFTWEPERPRATEDVRFAATAGDADGDPVSFAWDFGHVNASGRALAQGEAPTTFFYPAGEYVVTLTASDALEESRTTRTIVVLDAPPRAPADDGGAFGVAMPLWSPLAALWVAALFVADRRRDR